MSPGGLVGSERVGTVGSARIWTADLGSLDDGNDLCPKQGTPLYTVSDYSTYICHHLKKQMMLTVIISCVPFFVGFS